MGEFFNFTDGIKASGHYLGSNRLQPTPAATTVRIRDGKMSTTDGPFAETREQLGGYYLVEAPDLNDAIRIASKIPAAGTGVSRSAPFGRSFDPNRRGAGGMSEVIAEPIRAVVDTVYRSDSRRVLATLIRLLGDFDLAEEALHEAFAAAIERWPRDGVPANPEPGWFRPGGSGDRWPSAEVSLRRGTRGAGGPVGRQP